LRLLGGINLRVARREYLQCVTKLFAAAQFRIFVSASGPKLPFAMISNAAVRYTKADIDALSRQY
jgi:hypothetical protein